MRKGFLIYEGGKRWVVVEIKYTKAKMIHEKSALTLHWLSDLFLCTVSKMATNGAATSQYTTWNLVLQPFTT
jgi:hypothetical protein